MKWIQFLPLSVLFPLLSSCTQGYKIEGTSSASSLDGRMLYIQCLRGDKWEKIDSAEVVHGKFCMKGKVDSTQMVALYMGDVSIMPFVLESGKIRIELSDEKIDVSGTTLNKALYTFIDKKNAMDLELAGLDRKEARMVLDGADLNTVQQQLKHEQDSLLTAMNQYVKGFIADNYENVLGPSVFMMLCSSLPYPILTPPLEEIIKDAPYSFKSNKLVQEFLTKAKENRRLLDEQRLLEQNVGHSN